LITADFVVIVQKYEADDYRNVRFLVGQKLVRYICEYICSSIAFIVFMMVLSLSQLKSWYAVAVWLRAKCLSVICIQTFTILYRLFDILHNDDRNIDSWLVS